MSVLWIFSLDETSIFEQSSNRLRDSTIEHLNLQKGEAEEKEIFSSYLPFFDTQVKSLKAILSLHRYSSSNCTRDELHSRALYVEFTRRLIKGFRCFFLCFKRGREVVLFPVYFFFLYTRPNRGRYRYEILSRAKIYSIPSCQVVSEILPSRGISLSISREQLTAQTH